MLAFITLSTYNFDNQPSTVKSAGAIGQNQSRDLDIFIDIATTGNFLNLNMFLWFNPWLENGEVFNKYL